MKENCETPQRPRNLKEAIHSPATWKAIAGIVLGGLLGFLYYYNIGCSSGSCAITGNPYSSILFGAVLGFYLLNRPCSRC